MPALRVVRASCAINYRCKYTYSASNGAIAVTFDSFIGAEDGEPNGVGSVEISYISAMQDKYFFETESFDRV